jgi:hypothetical protein
MDNVGTSKRTATNDEIAPIKKNVVTEDVVAFVYSISNWVAKHRRKATNIASIIDISIVSAVGSIVHCAINHNAAPVENDGFDKLPSTINNTLSNNTMSHIDCLNSSGANSSSSKSNPMAKTGQVGSRVAIYNS